MASFAGFILTTKGLDIQSQAQAGAPLEFTRVAMGDGVAPAAPEDLQTLVSFKKDLQLVEVKSLGNGQARIRVMISNTDVAVGFPIREMGIFAKDPVTNIPHLYAYANAGNDPGMMPSANSANVFEIVYDLHTIIGNAPNVMAMINESLVYATQQDLNDLRDDLSGLARVSLDGPDIVFPGSNNQYTITDFSKFAAYTVAATVGTINQADELVTLDIAPNEAANGTTLTITRDGGEEDFNVAIGAMSIGQPSLVSPMSGSTGVGETPILSTSQFVSYPSAEFTHTSTDWQVATDAAFTNIVWESLADPNALEQVQIPVAILDTSTQYFVKARHHGSGGQGATSSGWTATVSFTTAGSFYLAAEIAQLTSQAPGANSSYFGQKYAISADGSQILVSAYWGSINNVQTGYVQAFRNDNGSWIYDGLLNPPGLVAQEWFGQGISLSRDGTLAVCCKKGKGYVISKQGGFWTKVAELDPVTYSGFNPDYFGHDCAISDAKDRIAIGVRGTSSNPGSVFIYDFDGTNWGTPTRLPTPEARASDLNNDRELRLSMSGDGLIVAVGSGFSHSVGIWEDNNGWGALQTLDEPNNGAYAGNLDMTQDGQTLVVGNWGDHSNSVFVYERQPSGQYALYVMITPPTAQLDQGFGNGVAISDDGSLLLIGAPAWDVGALNKAGTAYILTNHNGVWAHETQMLPAVSGSNKKFGLTTTLSGNGKTAMMNLKIFK